MTPDEKHALWLSLTPSQRADHKRALIEEEISRPNFNAAIVKRAQKRMERVDAFPPEIRAIIHEHGLEIVQEYWNHGVRKARSIQHLIATTLAWDNAEGNPRFGFNKSPNRGTSPLYKKMISVPREPTSAMIQASLAEVSGFDQRVTKTEKHRIRLRAALRAAEKEFGSIE